MSFFKKIVNKETVLYFIFGVLTTLLNWVTYSVFYKLLGVDSLISNIVAFIVAVLFAFFVNKLFVFESRSFEPKLAAKEFVSFVSGRILTFLLEEAGIWVSQITGFETKHLFYLFGFDVEGWLVTKIILSFIVLVLNYLIGKLLVFKNKKTHDTERTEDNK
ncbi:MAG: GtrA family protein [Clostridia bacterium]|nr:GtrA family protein [Clostridia bacterium]